MELMAAVGDLLEQIFDGSYPLWGQGLTRRAYGNYNVAQQATRWGRHHLERIALVDNGRLLSSAKTYDLELTVDGRFRRATGIGALFTPPECRDRGYGRELIERIAARAARAGHDYAVLFSEIAPEYYTRQGFVTVPLETVRLDVSRLPGAPGIVARSGYARDLQVLASMHAQFASPYRLSLVRTPEWVEYAISKKRLLAGLVPDGLNGALFYVVEEGGRAVAYVVATTGPRGWILEECGDRDPSGARVGALLQMLVAREPSVGTPPLHAWLPARWLPPQLSIAARAAASQVMMMRPLSDAARRLPPLGTEDVLWWHADAF